MFMTVIAAMAMITVSCSKDDDEITKEGFTDNLFQKGTTIVWEGQERTRRYNGGWYDDGQKYAVMRFDRTSNTATSGTGYVIYFKNSFKEELNYSGSFSEIQWYFQDNIMYVNYKRNEWPAVHGEYNTSELVVDGNTFKGTWYEDNDNKFEFTYSKSSFSDWNKYFN